MKVKVKCPPCPDCGVTWRVEVEESDFYAWQGGKHIQDAFPYLNADQREMLMTGYDQKCWDALFADLEDL